MGCETSKKEGRVWVVFCHWNKPYFIENQWDILGVFTTQEKAEEQVRRHREYDARDESHRELRCESICRELVLGIL